MNIQLNRPGLTSFIIGSCIIFITCCGKIENFNIQAHDDEVMSVSFSSDGRYIITGSRDGTSRIFDSENSWDMVCELAGHSSWVYQAEFLPGDREVVTAGFDSELKLWSLESCSEIRTYNGHTII